MKAIVFGGSGFLGSYVADELSGRGHDVVIFDRQESPYLRQDQKMVIGDILDHDQVSESVQGCDVAYSFAGIAGIADARRLPLETVRTNVLGTTNIVEACRQHQVKRFVFASTIYVYSDMAPFYRSSKQACELIIEDYQKTYGVGYTVLRYGSLYGRRANHFNFIHNVIQQAVEKGKIVRKGDGEELRDYIHVKDAARCSVDILSEEYRNQCVILTGNQSIKVKDLLLMIQEIFKNRIMVEYNPVAEPGHYEITPYTFKPKVAKKMLSSSYYDLGQGILDVIYEVYSNSDKNGLDISTLQQQMEWENLS